MSIHGFTCGIMDFPTGNESPSFIVIRDVVFGKFTVCTLFAIYENILRFVFLLAFINQAVTVLQTLVIALGAGLAVWGVVNLMEGYGNDNPGAKSQGIKQLMAGGGVVLIGTTLIPLLSGLFG